MRRFRSITGDVYVGNVLIETDNTIIMDNYSVWYEYDNSPFETTHADDSVQFTVESELSL